MPDFAQHLKKDMIGHIEHYEKYRWLADFFYCSYFQQLNLHDTSDKEKINQGKNLAKLIHFFNSL